MLYTSLWSGSRAGEVLPLTWPCTKTSTRASRQTLPLIEALATAYCKAYLGRPMIRQAVASCGRELAEAGRIRQRGPFSSAWRAFQEIGWKWVGDMIWNTGLGLQVDLADHDLFEIRIWARRSAERLAWRRSADRWPLLRRLEDAPLLDYLRS